MADDGYDILDRMEFTVTDSVTNPPASASVTYNLSGARKGYADGTVTILSTGNPTTTQYALYWGDANGKLADFNAIDTVARIGDTTAYTITANTFFPKEATRLLVYSGDGNSESDTPAFFDIPSGAKFDGEVPLYTFDVISDTHVQAWDSEQNERVNAAFQDLKKNDPNSSGIIIDGDTVDQGFDENYEKFFSIVNANKDGLAPVYLVMGNHEFMDFSTANAYRHADQEKLDKWLRYSQRSEPYYDTYLNGQHFIMLGSEEYSELSGGYDHDYADISETQFNWLRQKLAETKDKKEPIYLFLHQPMLETIAGSFEHQVYSGGYWNGVKPEQEAELRSILKDYPQVILFDGHTHWLLESDHEMYDGKGSFASIFNTASAGYLWSDANQEIDQSEGLFIEVYADRILVKGRNFTTGTWIPKAFLTVDLNEKYSGISDGGSGDTGSGGGNSGYSHSDGSRGNSGCTNTTDSSGKTAVLVSAQSGAAPAVTGGNPLSAR